MELSKENILSSTNNGLDIFRHYITGYKESRNFKSEFRDESTPSASIGKNDSGLPYYKDFGNGDHLYPIDFVMKKLSLDFKEALQKINQDLGLGLNGKSSFTPEVSFAEELKCYEYDFLKQSGITREVCQLLNVVSIDWHTVSKDGKIYKIHAKPNDFIIGYRIGECTFKTYRPLNKQYKFSWIGIKPVNYVFGYNQLPAAGETVFLSAGEKDALTLISHGYPAICTSSEAVEPTPELIADLKARFKNIIVLYDLDKTGREQSEKICSKYGLRNMILPMELYTKEIGKDVSDYFKAQYTFEYSDIIQVDTFENILKKTIEAAPLICESDPFSCYEMTYEYVPQYVRPLIKLQGENVLDKENISGVASGSGNGKSMCNEGIICSFLNPNCDTFHFETNIEPEEMVILFDGERSKKHTRAALGRIHKRIGLTCHWEILDPLKEDVKNGYWKVTDPNELDRFPNLKNFKLFYLNEIPTAKEKFEFIKKVIEYYNEKIGLVIIDGFGEITTETNQEAESSILYSTLKSYSSRFGFGIFGTIHTNPRDNKPRGWIGSEAWRVMQCMLLLSKAPNDPNVRLITTEFEFGKNRDGSDTLNSAFTWSHEDNMMVSVDYQKDNNGMDYKIKKSMSYIFSELLLKGMEEVQQKELKTLYVQAGFADTEATAQNHIKRAVEDFTILNERTDGKAKYYSLITKQIKG